MPADSTTVDVFVTPTDQLGSAQQLGPADGAAEADNVARLERARAEVGALPDIVALVEPDGTVIDVSSSVEHLGYHSGSLIGTNAFDLLHPDDHDFAARELLDELANPSRVAQSIILRIRRRNGQWGRSEVLGLNRLDTPGVGAIVLSVRDLSTARLNDRVIAASDQLFSTVAALNPGGMAIFDEGANLVYASPTLAPMFGYEPSEMADIIRAGSLLDPRDRKRWRRQIQEAMLIESGVASAEYKMRRKDGTTLFAELTILNLLHDPAVKGVVLYGRLVEDRRLVEIELRRHANEDQLTGLSNRRELMEYLNAPPRPRSRGQALLFCDLDDFKSVNDGFGHAAGDALLVEVAGAIRAALGDRELPSRIGGDEFCVYCDDVSFEDAVGTAERVRAHITNTCGPTGPVRVSIGLAWSDVSLRVTPDQLLTTADRAMYRAKHEGTNLLRVERCALGAETSPSTTSALPSSWL